MAEGKDRGWLKAPTKPPRSGARSFAKVDRDGRFLRFKDGTSNTLAVRSVVTEKMSTSHWFKPKARGAHVIASLDVKYT